MTIVRALYVYSICTLWTVRVGGVFRPSRIDTHVYTDAWIFTTQVVYIVNVKGVPYSSASCSRQWRFLNDAGRRTRGISTNELWQTDRRRRQRAEKLSCVPATDVFGWQKQQFASASLYYCKWFRFDSNILPSALRITGQKTDPFLYIVYTL